ncbi:MAG: cupin domain-containing protein [Deltaproteobacteria bacterium]|nr:cupin domain-containing protein [Deltaproteobacteria bacterium]
MRHPYNKVWVKTPFREGVEGYVFDGADGGQMIIWTCGADGTSPEHVHDFDEYLVVVQGKYTVIIDGEKIALEVGQEYLIPTGQAHAGEYLAGTRTIHAYEGRRAKRAIEERV